MFEESVVQQCRRFLIDILWNFLTIFRERTHLVYLKRNKASRHFESHHGDGNFGPGRIDQATPPVLGLGSRCKADAVKVVSQDPASPLYHRVA